MIDRLPRIAVAQSAQANPLYSSYLKNFDGFEPVAAQKTLASAIQIGNPVSAERAILILKQFDGIVEHATEDELANACAQADRTGLFTCPHTGVALAALLKLVDRKVIARGSKVVVVSTAHGLKFPNFKTDYHAGALGDKFDVTSRHANAPVEVDADYDQVRDRVMQSIDSIAV